MDAVSWQAEVSDLLAYGRQIGLGFEEAWREAVACVEVPSMCALAPAERVHGMAQLSLDDPAPQSVLAFFKDVCARAWAGEEVVPAGCFDTVMDTGGVAGIGKSRRGGG